MIALHLFLAKVAEIVAERPSYSNGGFGLRGICDCIGLIIGAVRRAGGVWRGVHGSNFAARNMMVTFGPIDGFALGDIVYKGRAPDQAGYSLPSTYAAHPDRTDYYHVGVVTSVNPLRITHCTSWRGGSGIKVDTKRGNWRFGGRLKGVDYGTAYSGADIPATPEPSVPATPALPATRALRVIKGVPLMRGEDVRQVQQALIDRGYSVGSKGADGIYGWDTQRAVLAWQMQAFPGSARDWDGVVGQASRLKLMGVA